MSHQTIFHGVLLVWAYVLGAWSALIWSRWNRRRNLDLLTPGILAEAERRESQFKHNTTLTLPKGTKARD
jgi:hypothetical protein